MNFVKAIERLPKKEGLYNCKHDGQPVVYKFVVSMNAFCIPGAHTRNKVADQHSVEWLDESPSGKEDVQEAARKNFVKEYKGSLEQYAVDNFIAGASWQSNRSENQDEWRPVVKWFAYQMEAALKRNDHKTGWLNDDWDELYDRILEEAEELYNECSKFQKDHTAIIKEAADVANFAMMIADKFGKQLGQYRNLPTNI